MTREEAIVIEEKLRSYYNEYPYKEDNAMPTIIVNGEDVTHLYDKIVTYDFLDKYPEFKIENPVIPRLVRDQAVDLIMKIYEGYKLKKGE